MEPEQPLKLWNWRKDIIEPAQIPLKFYLVHACNIARGENSIQVLPLPTTTTQIEEVYHQRMSLNPIYALSIIMGCFAMLAFLVTLKEARKDYVVCVMKMDPKRMDLEWLEFLLD